MIAFIDDHRGAHGVEPICKVLPIAPSTYHAHVAKRRDPAKLSARARQDATLKIEVRRVFDEKFRAYGVTAMLTIRNILAGERVYDVWNVNEDAEYHESGGTDVKEALNSERLVPRKL